MQVLQFSIASYESKGRGFESRRAHKTRKSLQIKGLRVLHFAEIIRKISQSCAIDSPKTASKSLSRPNRKPQGVKRESANPGGEIQEVIQNTGLRPHCFHLC